MAETHAVDSPRRARAREDPALENARLRAELARLRSDAGELDHTVDLLSAALEQTGAGVCIFDAPSMRLRFANRALARIFGREGSAPTGASAADLASEVRFLRPDGSPLPFDELPSRRAAMGESVVQAELCLQNEDGARRVFLNNSSPLRDDDGKIVAVVSILSEITDRVAVEEDRARAEEARRLTQRKYARIFEASPEAVFLMREDDLKIVECNPAFERKTGYRAKEAVGRTTVDLGLWADLSQRQGLVDALQETGECTNYPVDLRSRDGSEIKALLSTRTFAVGEELYVLVVARDETERHQMVREHERLRGLLPICASCKSIRNDSGYWQQLEQYLGEHSGTEFSHGVCPDCARELFPEVFDDVLGAGSAGSPPAATSTAPGGRPRRKP